MWIDPIRDLQIVQKMMLSNTGLKPNQVSLYLDIILLTNLNIGEMVYRRYRDHKIYFIINREVFYLKVWPNEFAVAILPDVEVVINEKLAKEMLDV